MPNSVGRRLHQDVRRHRGEGLMQSVLFACAAGALLMTVAFIAVLTIEAAGFFAGVPDAEALLSGRWQPFEGDGWSLGVPLSGTLLVTLIAGLVALPVGVLVALYIDHYAPPSLRRVLGPAIDVLATIPTVVYGYFALVVLTPMLQRAMPGLPAFNALSASLVIGLMILPTVVLGTRLSLRRVPMSLQLAANALGATRREMLTGVLLPAARPGMIAAAVFALVRAAGETMAVTIAAGSLARTSFDLLGPVTTLSSALAQIGLSGQLQGSLADHAMFAVALLLFVISAVLGVFGYRMELRERRGEVR